ENTTTGSVTCGTATWNYNGITVEKASGGLFAAVVDKNNNVYVTDTYRLNDKGRVAKWTPNTTSGLAVAQYKAQALSAFNYRDDFGLSQSMFLDDIGNLYVANSLGTQVRSVPGVGG
ncbi:unnamed protein product, partial [Didymodactylos carnosus]